MNKSLTKLMCWFIPNTTKRRQFYQKHAQQGMDINGQNNVIYIDGSPATTCPHSTIAIQITGNNNEVILPEAHCFKNCSIYINANNSKILIAAPCNVHNSHISICCGDNQVITIGDHLTCYGCIFHLHEAGAAITIGNDCLFSNSISFWATDGHTLLDAKTNKIINHMTDEIKIGNHVWIGEGAKVLKNVKISDNSVVGAASVVCKQFDDTNVAIAGNPAKVVRRGITWAHPTPTQQMAKQKDLKK